MKWYTYLICFISIVLGAFCGAQFYRKVKAESYINGSIDITNQFSQENFNYTSSKVVFYNDIYDETNTYLFETDLPVVENFNGVSNNYEVTLNGHLLMNCNFTAGSISTVVYIDFYDIDGKVVCSSDLKVSIKYLSDKTTLCLSTIGLENASYLEQYFSTNGIRLIVNEIL